MSFQSINKSNKNNNNNNNNNKRARREPKSKEEQRKIQLSKALSRVLRHKAEKMGVPLDDAGYAPLAHVLRLNQFRSQKFTQEEVMRVVEQCEKQRFAVKQHDNKWLIRANQGHTIATIQQDKLLSKLTLQSAPAVAYHGTYRKSWQLIKQRGLSRMKRNHLHLAKGMPDDSGVISGMRSNCHLVIRVDVHAAIKAGIEFFESDNGVLLTAGDADGFVPCDYFSAVFDFKRKTPFDSDFPGLEETPESTKEDTDNDDD